MKTKVFACSASRLEDELNTWLSGMWQEHGRRFKIRHIHQSQSELAASAFVTVVVWYEVMIL